MAESKTGYAGKIGNSATQKVEAPFPAGSAKKGIVHKGKDLRTGK